MDGNEISKKLDQTEIYNKYKTAIVYYVICLNGY